MVTDSASENSTRDILLNATSKKLWGGDESELRILDICQETNLSTSVIYANFRSRQGLIDASLLHIFTGITEEIVRDLGDLATGPHPKGSFIDTLYDLLTTPEHLSRITRLRQMFFRVSASALSRPSIRPGFIELYESFMNQMDALYDDLVRRNLLSSQLTGHQWGLFFEGQMLSRAFHDLSTIWDEPDDWNLAARHFLNAARPEIVS